jgi:diguanylate cyclase (GGDEF)-like protein
VRALVLALIQAATPGITPQATPIEPRLMLGSASIVMAVLLQLLYFYRRRIYILFWVTGWVLTAASMFLVRKYSIQTISFMALGIAQFVHILAALMFVVAADAYGHRPRLRRGYALLLLPVAIWFTLAPAALQAKAVFAPGQVLIAGAFAGAGVAYLLLLRQARLLGAAVIAVSLMTLGAINLWIAAAAPQADSPANGRGLVISTIVSLVAALAMQLMTFEDMTYELQRTNRRLESAQSDLRQLVITDPLTGCRNRRFFDEVIGRELQRHRRYETPLSLLFIDIDRFKSINDALGHETGDRVLRQVAAFLLRNIREADYVFRWGGDEFLVLISCTEPEAQKRGEELQMLFSIAPETAGLPAGVGLSVGSIEIPANTKDVMPLVQTADERMYVNKKRAR